MADLARGTNRMVYLITYAQADIVRFPNPLTFANAILQSCNTCFGPDKVEKWVCAKERHADGGMHFHMALIFTTQRRWSQLKATLQSAHNIGNLAE